MISKIPREIRKGAVVSPCGTYRYRLWRNWGDRPDVNFVLLNPSTADAEQDDPTIRKCMGFADRLGYGGIIVTNLFALRATDPRELRRVRDPVGPLNDQNLVNVAGHRQQVGMVICGWGEHGAYLNRARIVMQLLKIENIWAYALGVNTSGQPKHPLYISYKAQPVPLDSYLTPRNWPMPLKLIDAENENPTSAPSPPGQAWPGG